MHSTETRSDDYERLTPKELTGGMLFLSGIALLVFSFFAASAESSFSLPRFWYRAEWLWPFVGIGVAIFGLYLQRSRSVLPATWKPSLPGQRFHRLVVYTRENCHLCDVAKDSLHRFSNWLPQIEEIDIEESAELTQRYETRIPVVEIDGEERFSGVVNELLLKRLIEGTAPRETADRLESHS